MDESELEVLSLQHRKLFDRVYEKERRISCPEYLVSWLEKEMKR